MQLLRVRAGTTSLYIISRGGVHFIVAKRTGGPLPDLPSAAYSARLAPVAYFFGVTATLSGLVKMKAPSSHVWNV